MIRLALLAPLLLASCAAMTPTPRAVEAGIAGDVLRVAFSDGSACRATLGPEGGAGAFPDCTAGAAYAVTVLARNPLEPVLGAAVAPYAEIEVTVAGTVSRFVTPLSRRPGFDN
jgi:hypothetical protein